jgi:hypothetical protein
VANHEEIEMQSRLPEVGGGGEKGGVDDGLAGL